MKRLGLIILALLISQATEGQQLSDSYYRENPSWIDAELWASDGVFQPHSAPISAPYEHFSLYGFSFVDYSPRGVASAYGLTTYLGVIDLHNPLDAYPDYSLISLLRRSPLKSNYTYTISHSERTTAIRSEEFQPSPFEAHSGSKLKLSLASRTYRMGIGYTLTDTVGDSFGYSLAVGGRWGNDAIIEGLFSNEEYLWLSGEWRKNLSEGLTSSLQVAFMVAPSIRSQRSWNTEEVFGLADTPNYNSYWGYQNGKPRSSRIRREAMPTLYGSWRLHDKYILSDVNISALLQGGRKSQSSLDWASAPSPMPDYYGYLPSGSGDANVALEAERVWLEGDRRYTQIDWDRLYAINRISPNGAHYLIMDERSDRLSATLDCSAGLLGVEGGRVGIKGAWHTSKEYTSPRDLLGGSRPAEGFDLYDYTLSHRSWALYTTLYGSFDWGRLSAAAEMGGTALDYSSATHSSLGNYYNTFRVRACWDNRLSESLSVGATASHILSAPHHEALFGSPEGMMRLNPYAQHGPRSTNGEVWGRWNGKMLTITLTLYGSYSSRESSVEHFWNDITDQYSTLLAGDIRSLAGGAELSVEASLSSSLRLGGYASVGMYRHIGSGVGDIVEYDSGAKTATATIVHTEGLTPSSAPQSTGAITLKYFTPKGWMFGAEWAVVAGRHLAPALLPLSDYILSRVEIPEEQKALKSQASLGTASTLNLFVYRRMGAWTLSLSLRNLLNNTSALRGGYQPSRVVVSESDYANSYRPQAARYQHLYPCHLYISVGYEF